MPKTADQISLSQVDLSALSNDEIIFLRKRLEKELKRRKIRFNTGEIGEKIAIEYFNRTPGLHNLQQAPPNTKNVDAISRSGERYSIKTIKDGGKTGTVYHDIEKERQLFEYLLLVLLDEDYQLKALYRYSWEEFVAARKRDIRMNAWYISKPNKSVNNCETIFCK